MAMQLVPNIIAYHSNDKGKCEKFVSENNLIWCGEDGEWAGRGMYFWDNLSNAKYWMHQNQKRKVGNYSIVQATLLIDKLMDLTDQDVRNAIGKLWICLITKIEKENMSFTLGAKINFLYDHTELIIKCYPIIKMFGEYNNTPSDVLFQCTIQSKRDCPTIKAKCVYCVKDSLCIAEGSRCFVSL